MYDVIDSPSWLRRSRPIDIPRKTIDGSPLGGRHAKLQIQRVADSGTAVQSAFLDFVRRHEELYPYFGEPGDDAPTFSWAVHFCQLYFEAHAEDSDPMVMSSIASQCMYSHVQHHSQQLLLISLRSLLGDAEFDRMCR